jgi:hypothetical protein
MNEHPLEIVSDGLKLQGVLTAPESDSWPLVI